MILQVKHFIHSSYFDSFGRRLHSDLLDRLERTTATIRGRQAERFPRDTVLEMYLSSTPSSFSSSLFFCSGNRNAKDAEMKRVLPSTIRRPHRLPLQPDCSVFVSSRSSFSFVPRVFPLLSSQPEQGEKEFTERVPRARSLLSDITFILFRALSLSGRCPCSSILSSTSRFVSSRLYRLRVRDQNRSESPRYLRQYPSRSTISWSTISRQERAVYIPL